MRFSRSVAAVAAAVAMVVVMTTWTSTATWTRADAYAGEALAAGGDAHDDGGALELELERERELEATMPPLARAWLANLTLAEKLGMLHGVAQTRGYTGYVPAVARLGIPALRMNDGPQGFRGPAGTSTAWPCGLALAATFDPGMAHDVAVATAREFARKGANVLLGPGVNIARIPTNGRNFEYVAGEDALLGEKMAAAFVRGAQSVRGIMTTVKHYVNNDQETNRAAVDAVVDAATEWNLYYRPFVAAIRAGSWGVMCSYNNINGSPGCSSRQTLQTDLRNRMKFRGFVVSDWFATRDTRHSANNGLDIEMPVPLYFGDRLGLAVKTRLVSQRKIDIKVGNILRAIVESGAHDVPTPAKDALYANATSDEHTALARRVAAASAVLLRNERGALPIPASHRVAVVGDRAHNRPLAVGQGSGHVQASHVVTVLEGLRQSGTFKPSVAYVPSTTRLSAGMKQTIEEADTVVVVVGAGSSEGFDRTTLGVDASDEKLIRAVAALSNNVVVWVSAPGAVTMPWADHPNVTAVAIQFFAGQEMGNSVADVLSGRVVPRGRLPVSIPFRDNEVNFTAAQYPGVNLKARYTEKTRVGYRWYLASTAAVRPRFAFGFGLAGYGRGKARVVRGRVLERFSFSSLVPPFSPSEWIVDLAVACHGEACAGGQVEDVLQVYARFPNANEDGRGEEFLVAWERVRFSRGSSASGTQHVRIRVDARAVEMFDPEHPFLTAWRVPRGRMSLVVGRFAGDPDAVELRVRRGTVAASSAAAAAVTTTAMSVVA